jgi:hypothetical protein
VHKQAKKYGSNLVGVVSFFKDFEQRLKSSGTEPAKLLKDIACL